MAIQKVSAQLFTLREFEKTEEEFITTMQRLSEMGFEYAQFSGVTAPMKPARVKEIMDVAGIKICCTHMPWERLRDNPEQVAEDNIAMGNTVVGFGSYTENKLAVREDVDRYLKQLEQIGAVMKKYGLTLAIHNHWNEFHRFDGKSVLQITRENTDPEAIEFIFCCYWALYSGADPVEYIREFKGRITCCHYKDMTMRDGERTFAPVGEGNMNYRAIWDACEETGVKYALIEQDRCFEDPFVCVAKSKAYMESLSK
ncbi:MAG: sugar phosphate isomerase/epimerase [Oscillospiraceae bacterium]|nr:sugar phosphate isomerase/epimerase [Oscillospiraceae bacterium]